MEDGLFIFFSHILSLSNARIQHCGSYESDHGTVS